MIATNEGKFVTRKVYETEMTLIVCDDNGAVSKPTVTVPGDWEEKQGRGLKKLVKEAWEKHEDYAADKTLVTFKTGDVYVKTYRMALDDFLSKAELVPVDEDETDESNAE